MTSRPHSEHDLSRRTLGRRGFLAATAAASLAVGAGFAAPARAAAGRAKSGSTFRASLSVSPFTEAVLRKVSLTDGSRTARTVKDLQCLYVDHGATEVFVRVATRETATDGDAEHGSTRALERARLAKKLGLPLNPELGLWNVYGDISHQPGPDFSAYPEISLPGPWESLTIDQMGAALRQYGALVARQILGTGVEVNVWDLGNEVEFGVAGVGLPSFTSSTEYWSYSAPDAVDPMIGLTSVYSLYALPENGRNSWLEEHLWPYTGRLLAAVAEGIRSVDTAARFSTHTSTLAFTFPGLIPAFWRAMTKAGFEADEFGTSFYPTSSAAVDQVAAFKSAAATLHSTYGKQTFIAETGYPSGTMSDPYAWNDAVAGYPLTPQGEYEFLRDITAWGAETGYVSGMRPWGPDYCTSGWQPMSHFTVSGAVGTAEPALDALADGLTQAAG
ncbi:glycosyl hydrolase 53 family protein [Streptomyces sp. NPDC055681]